MKSERGVPIHFFPFACNGGFDCFPFRTANIHLMLRPLHERWVKNEKKLIVDDSGCPKFEFLDENFMTPSLIMRNAKINVNSQCAYKHILKLLENGLVYTKQNPKHKKGKIVAITPKGISCYRCYLNRNFDYKI